MANGYNIQSSAVTNLFKVKYQPKTLEVLNTEGKTLAKIKKSSDNTGTQVERPTLLGYQGGAGSGTLPSANSDKTEKAIFDTQRVYVTCEVDRHTQMLAKSEGAFVDMMKHAVKRSVQKMTWNQTRILYGRSDGSLGTANVVSAVSAPTTYTFTVTDATWKLRNWEVRDYINFGSSTDKFEITAVAPATKTISITRVNGSYVPQNSDVVYLQNSKDNDPYGLAEKLDATTSTHYNIPIQYRWQATQINADSVGLDEDLILQGLIGVESVTGTTPDMFVTSYKQFRKLMSANSDLKRYMFSGDEQARYANFSWKGMKFQTANGVVSIFAEPFVEDDRFYGLDSDHIEECRTPGFGWVDEDTDSVFLRKAGGDGFEARLTAYYENFFDLPYHFVIDNLA